MRLIYTRWMVGFSNCDGLFWIAFLRIRLVPHSRVLAHNWASSREKLSSGVCEQQRRRPACASAQSDQRLCYSLFGKYHINACYKWNFNFLASHCSWAGWFESHFVGNPEDRFSHVAAQLLCLLKRLYSWYYDDVLMSYQFSKKKKHSFRDVSNPYLNPCPAHPKLKAFVLKTLKMQISCYWRDNLIALSLLSSSLLNLTFKMENRMSKGYSCKRGMMGGGGGGESGIHYSLKI